MSHSKDEIVVGIDLGTTNSAIAAVVNGELVVVPVAGNPTMPSAVGLDPAGKLIVGQPAKNQQVSSPENTILSIKRHMGTDYRETLGGREYGPEEISALILGELKRAAEAHFDRPVNRAVITVPAFFNEAQRKATQAAGVLAGFEVLRIINEPTAAALAYGGGSEGMKEGETMLVYDLGGGTFDVSVVRVEKGIVEVKASFGDTKLGGDDFDDALVDVGASRFAEQAGAPDLPPAARRRLKGIMEAAKIRLSDEPFAPVHEDYLADEFHLVTEISRTEYESLINPMLEKTLACVRRAMADAEVTANEIDRIMLVGGATRTPVVHSLLLHALSKPPRHEISPDLIVAMGAAIQGAALAGAPAPAILIDITAHTYSTLVLSQYRGLICCPIIPRGTPLPVSRAEVFATSVDDQKEVEVTVHQGESLLPDRNTLLGDFIMKGLAEVPAGNEVVIRFQLDLNGLLTATGTEKSTGRSEQLVVDTHGGHRLNLDAARANLAELFAEADDEADDEADADGEEWEDAVEFDDQDDDESGPVEDEGGSAEDGQAPAGLLATARNLRKRAEAILERGVAEGDAAEIRQCLDSVSETIRARDWTQVNQLANTLSDILFYLED